MLEYDSFYHIYNQGNNHEGLFCCPTDYRLFLKLFEEHISPVADTFAWGLMTNHFHLLVRIKDETEILPFSSGPNREKKPTPSRQFSHLFNAYAQSFNKKYSRTGCLFKTPFQRIKLNSLDNIINLVLYIHTNPVHHKLTMNFKTYPWTSYESIILGNSTVINRKTILEWFDDLENFKIVHEAKESVEIEKNICLEEL